MVTPAPPLGFKPDLILMLADDLGWNNVGWRNAELRTPALDEGRATGIDLQRMYAFKYCSPTRSSLMSGRLPLHVTQNNKNNDVENPGGADLRMTLLPQSLKAAGYRTAMAGKWHVGARSAANLPINRGFHSHFGFLKGGEDHLTQRSGDGGLAFVVHSDGRGTFATGCAGGGLGYAADPAPHARCHARITSGVAIALHADHVRIVRTDVDFATPLYG